MLKIYCAGDTIKELESYSNLWKKDFSSIRRRNWGLTRNFILRRISEDPQIQTILDYGCAKGSIDIDKITKKYFGYDMDIHNSLAAFHSLKEMGDKRFDVIILSHVLEHMTLKEIKDVILWCEKHTDKVIIVIPNNNIFWDFWGDLTHVRPYPYASFLNLIEQWGFGIKSYYVSDLNPGSVGVNPISCFFRTLFCIIMGLTPFYDFVVFAEKSASSYEK